MKKSVPPAVMAGIVAAAVLLIGLVYYWGVTPSSHATAVPPSQKDLDQYQTYISTKGASGGAPGSPTGSPDTPSTAPAPAQPATGQ